MELIGAINACSIFIPAKRQTGELEIEVVCKAAKELENEKGGREERLGGFDSSANTCQMPSPQPSLGK